MYAFCVIFLSLFCDDHDKNRQTSLLVYVQCNITLKTLFFFAKSENICENNYGFIDRGRIILKKTLNVNKGG